MQAAAKTLDDSWQAEDIGAAAARAAAGACGLVESQMNSLPSYPAEKRVVCSGRSERERSERESVHTSPSHSRADAALL